MPESSDNDSPHNDPNEPSAPSEPSANHRPVVLSSGGRALSVVALVVAVVAGGLAGWALLRPVLSSSQEPEFTEEQRTEANAKLCKAYDIVRRGVTLNTNQVNPGGREDAIGALAVAANARVSLYDGGQYLLARIDPANSADLADAVSEFGNVLMDIGAASTARIPNSDPDQAARLRDGDGLNVTIGELCK